MTDLERFNEGQRYSMFLIEGLRESRLFLYYCCEMSKQFPSCHDDNLRMLPLKIQD